MGLVLNYILIMLVLIIYGSSPFDDDSVQFVNMMRMSMGMLLLREINQNFNKRTQLF